MREVDVEWILSIIKKLWYFLEYDIILRAHSKSLGLEK